MVVVTVVAMRVVDEVEVEAGATAQDFEADEAEGLQWRFILQSSSDVRSTSTNFTLPGSQVIPSLLLAPRLAKLKIFSKQAFRLAGV